MNRTRYFTVLWICNPTPSHPGHRPILFVIGCRIRTDCLPTYIGRVTAGTKGSAAPQNVLTLSPSQILFSTALLVDSNHGCPSANRATSRTESNRLPTIVHSACENRICLSLGFFSFRFHHRGRPFEFI